MKIKPFNPERLKIAAEKWNYPIIEIVPWQLVITKRTEDVKKEELRQSATLELV